MWCFKMHCAVNGGRLYDEDEDDHSFSGYGFYVKYHEECCPRTVDGSDCGFNHFGRKSRDELIAELLLWPTGAIFHIEDYFVDGNF